MYDYWMVIIGGVFGLWGLFGLLTGSITIYYKSHSGWSGHRPLFTYHGRGLPLVFTLMGGILVVLYLLSHNTPPRIPRTTANTYAGYVLVGGLVLSFLVATFQGLGFSTPSLSRPKKIKGVSLAEAARFLKMSESDLLQTAENGGIKAQRANGSYIFSPNVLQDFQESRARLNTPFS